MKTNDQGKTYRQVLDELQTFVNNSEYIEEIYVSVLPTEENFTTEVCGRAAVLHSDIDINDREVNRKLWDELMLCEDLFRNFFAPDTQESDCMFDDDGEEICFGPNYYIDFLPNKWKGHNFYAHTLFMSKKSEKKQQ
jgi:hypothetical protein